MAGKKIASKKKAETDGPQSKTARASMAKKGKQEGFHAAADYSRVISLGGGTHIYLLDPRDGKTHRLQVGSSNYNNVVSEILATNHGELIQAQLEGQGFPVPVLEVVE